MQLRKLDANLLVVLDALLKEASVTKAAKNLGRSPSAVSHALSNLRHLFEDELFVRAGQKLVPTVRAQKLAKSVHDVVLGMEKLLSPPTRFDPMTENRCFSFAANQACELTLLHCMRETLKKENSHISIGWKSLHKQQSFDDLRAGDVHFVLYDGKPQAEKAADFIWQKLFEESYVTLACPGHPLSSHEISKQQYATAEHVMITGEEGGGNSLETHFEKQGVRPNISVRASSVFAGLFLALDSHYLVSVPASVARAIRKRVPFSTIHQPFTPLQCAKHLGWHKSQTADEGHMWLREKIVNKVAGGLV